MEALAKQKDLRIALSEAHRCGHDARRGRTRCVAEVRSSRALRCQRHFFQNCGLAKHRPASSPAHGSRRRRRRPPSEEEEEEEDEEEEEEEGEEEERERARVAASTAKLDRHTEYGEWSRRRALLLRQSSSSRGGGGGGGGGGSGSGGNIGWEASARGGGASRAAGSGGGGSGGGALGYGMLLADGSVGELAESSSSFRPTWITGVHSAALPEALCPSLINPLSHQMAHNPLILKRRSSALGRELQ